MNTTKIKQRIGKLQTDGNVMDALASIVYFLPNGIPLRALLDEPGAIFAANPEVATHILNRLLAEKLIAVDANDFISLAPEFKLICESDICEFLPPPSYLQSKTIGETFVGAVISAVKKSDEEGETLYKIWSAAMKNNYIMLANKPESGDDRDLPRYYSRIRLACELLGEDEQARFWEGKVFECHGVKQETTVTKGKA